MTARYAFKGIWAQLEVREVMKENTCLICIDITNCLIGQTIIQSSCPYP